jgi:hypothetical protein
MAFLKPKLQQLPIEQLNNPRLENDNILTSDDESDQSEQEIETSENGLEVQYPQAGKETLTAFYQLLSAKNIEELQKLFDTPLQKSADIQRFFSDYRIPPFIDNIEGNNISPENIELLTTSPSGIEEYQYNINYTLKDQAFSELRRAKIKYTPEGAKVASIHCESHRCSYNPFFRPESYGLIQ